MVRTYPMRSCETKHFEDSGTNFNESVLSKTYYIDVYMMIVNYDVIVKSINKLPFNPYRFPIHKLKSQQLLAIHNAIWFMPSQNVVCIKQFDNDYD